MYTENCTLESLDVAFFTLYAAKKYMVKALAIKCGNYVLEQMSISNACSNYQRAFALDEVELSTKIRAFIEKYAPVVFATQGFLSLSENVLSALLLDQKLMILEADLLIFLVKWATDQLTKAQQETGDYSENSRTIADVIKPIAHLIRFPLIPHKHLFKLNNEYHLLEAAELQSILKYQTGSCKDCTLPYIREPRGHKVSTRFKILDDFDLSSLITKDDKERRKFTLEFRPTSTQKVTIFGVSIMCGPYVVRVAVFDADDQLVSFTERDFSGWQLKDCCRETCIILADPVQCGANTEENMRIEVHISKCQLMYWYDNVITGKPNDTKHLKLKHVNPEIISKIHYLLR